LTGVSLTFDYAYSDAISSHQNVRSKLNESCYKGYWSCLENELSLMTKEKIHHLILVKMQN